LGGRFSELASQRASQFAAWLFAQFASSEAQGKVDKLRVDIYTNQTAVYLVEHHTDVFLRIFPVTEFSFGDICR